MLVNDHELHKNQPGKGDVDQTQQGVPEQNPPASDQAQRKYKGRISAVLFAKTVKNGSRKTQQTHQGWNACIKFVNLPQQLEIAQQYPVEQWRFVVIKLAVQGWSDVVAGEFHFQGYQGADTLIVDEGHQAQVDQQGWKQQ